MRESIIQDLRVKTVRDLPLAPVYVPAEELTNLLEIRSANCSTCLFNFAATRGAVCDFKNCVRYPNLDQRTIPSHYDHLPCWSPDHRLCLRNSKREVARFQELQVLYTTILADFKAPWYLRPFLAIHNFIRWHNVRQGWIKFVTSTCRPQTLAPTWDGEERRSGPREPHPTHS